jgi:hypothetical protein
MTQKEIDQLIADEINNFILYYTSEFNETLQMQIALKDYMAEVYQRPTYSERKYEVAVDFGEDGTMTIAAFATEPEAKAFLHEYSAKHPSRKVFIDTCTYDFFNNNR